MGSEGEFALDGLREVGRGEQSRWGLEEEERGRRPIVGGEVIQNSDPNHKPAGHVR